MRQHSVMSGLSSACPLPLLANFAAWTPRMSGALRRLSLLYFKKSRLKNELGASLFACCGKKYSSGKKKYVADRAKTLLINIRMP